MAKDDENVCYAISNPRAALTWTTLAFFAGFSGVSAFGPIVPKLKQVMDVDPFLTGKILAGLSRPDRLPPAHSVRGHGRPYGRQEAHPDSAAFGRRRRRWYHAHVQPVANPPRFRLPVFSGHLRHPLRLRHRGLLGRGTGGLLLVPAAQTGYGPRGLRRAGEPGAGNVRPAAALPGGEPRVHLVYVCGWSRCW